MPPATTVLGLVPAYAGSWRLATCSPAQVGGQAGAGGGGLVPSPHPCPLSAPDECSWSPWSPWSPCSCSSPLQHRHRHRHGPGTCVGLDGELRDCDTSGCSGEEGAAGDPPALALPGAVTLPKPSCPCLLPCPCPSWCLRGCPKRLLSPQTPAVSPPSSSSPAPPPVPGSAPPCSARSSARPCPAACPAASAPRQGQEGVAGVGLVGWGPPGWALWGQGGLGKSLVPTGSPGCKWMAGGTLGTSWGCCRDFMGKLHGDAEGTPHVPPSTSPCPGRGCWSSAEPACPPSSATACTPTAPVAPWPCLWGAASCWAARSGERGLLRGWGSPPHMGGQGCRGLTAVSSQRVPGRGPAVQQRGLPG